MLWKKIRISSTCPHDFVNTKLKALFIKFFLLIVDISQQKLSTISFIYACILALRLRYTIEEHSLVVFTLVSGETGNIDPDSMPRARPRPYCFHKTNP